jgi:ribonuclease HI
MRITGNFAGICEPCSPGGFAAYGVVVKIDGVILWTDSAAVGHGHQVSTNIARYRGAIALLKKLRELQTANPEAHITMITDSATTIQELEGAWRGHVTDYKALLDDAAELVTRFDGGLDLRYCARRDNLESHDLAKDVLRRAGMKFPDRFIRRAL